MHSGHAVYLIGTNHTFQLGERPFGDTSNGNLSEFGEMLRTAIATHAIRAVAEEMSRQALGKFYVTGDSVPCLIATELGLPHRYCDPETTTRAEKGIKSKEDRERYWLGQLTEFDVFPVLFVFGADHAESFSRLLTESGFDVYLLAKDWCPTGRRRFGSRFTPISLRDGNLNCRPY